MGFLVREFLRQPVFSRATMFAGRCPALSRGGLRKTPGASSCGKTGFQTRSTVADGVGFEFMRPRLDQKIGRVVRWAKPEW